MGSNPIENYPVIKRLLNSERVETETKWNVITSTSSDLYQSPHRYSEKLPTFQPKKFSTPEVILSHDGMPIFLSDKYFVARPCNPEGVGNSKMSSKQSFAVKGQDLTYQMEAKLEIGPQSNGQGNRGYKPSKQTMGPPGCHTF